MERGLAEEAAAASDMVGGAVKVVEAMQVAVGTAKATEEVAVETVAAAVVAVKAEAERAAVAGRAMVAVAEEALARATAVEMASGMVGSVGTVVVAKVLAAAAAGAAGAAGATVVVARARAVTEVARVGEERGMAVMVASTEG